MGVLSRAFIIGKATVFNLGDYKVQGEPEKEFAFYRAKYIKVCTYT